MTVSQSVGSKFRNRTLIVACLLATNYALLLAVVPVIVARRGVSSEAGAATAVLFAATVLGELSAPILMSSVSSRLLAVVAMLVAGPPSLLYLSSPNDLVPILLCTFVRGAGFGLAVVVCTAVISNVAAQDKRGVAIGSYGLVTTTPLVVAPSIGLLLLGAGHLEFAIGISALAATLGAIVALGLPSMTGLAPLFRRPHLGHRRATVATTFVCLAVAHLSYGGLISFVPVHLPANGLDSSAMFLFVAGIARTLSRYWAGIVVDSYKASRVVLVGIVSMALGLLLVPMSSATPLLIAAAGIYGVGHGAVQTATYVSLLQHSNRSEVAIVSAGWNVAVDFGVAAGAAILGAIAVTYGIVAVFWVLPFMVATAIPVAFVGTHRQEPNNPDEP